jgi:nitrous oxidase accessory protein NosD
VAFYLKEKEMRTKTRKNLAIIVLCAVSVLGTHTFAVTVPAGSVDQLAAAIAEAGPGGEVVLAAGLHKISGTVMVDIVVSIVGEEGAILETANSTDDEGVKPALYIKGADGVRIQNLIIQTPLDPNVAPASNGILIENASDVQIIDNQIAGHVNGVLVEHGDRALLKGNAIKTTAHCIVVINGDDVSIQDNWLSGPITGTGLWVGGERGDISGNTFQGCGIGLLLCTPRGFLISGEVRMTDTPATGWMVYQNNAVGGAWGYLAFDGANNNVLMNNSAALNANYDIELGGESSRFGFVSPTSFDNTVIQGLKYKGLKVKVCGIDNQAQGHVNLVDTTEDPCF